VSNGGCVRGKCGRCIRLRLGEEGLFGLSFSEWWLSMLVGRLRRDSMVEGESWGWTPPDLGESGILERAGWR